VRYVPEPRVHARPGRQEMHVRRTWPAFRGGELVGLIACVQALDDLGEAQFVKEPAAKG